MGFSAFPENYFQDEADCGIDHLVISLHVVKVRPIKAASFAPALARKIQNCKGDTLKLSFLGGFLFDMSVENELFSSLIIGIGFA